MSSATSSLCYRDDHLLVYRVLYIACGRELVDRREAGAAIQYLVVRKAGGLFCYGGRIIRNTARILFIEVSLLFTGIGARCYRSVGWYWIYFLQRDHCPFISFNKCIIIRC
jgi:hypothetical protein